ncbi:MAG: glycosyl hydrolase family 28-related protein, partial [Armatimonadota bacterium]
NPDRTANPQTDWAGAFHSSNRASHDDWVTVTITFPSNVTFDHIAWNSGSTSGSFWNEPGFTPAWSAILDGNVIVNCKPMDTGGPDYYMHDPTGATPEGDQQEMASFPPVTGRVLVLGWQPISRSGGYYWSVRDVNIYNSKIYDFVASAPGAVWSNPAQSVSWNNQDQQGYCCYSSGTLEDGSYGTNVLFTHPDWRGDISEHYMRGSYSVAIPSDSPNVTFNATVGFTDGASSTQGVIYKLLLYRYGQWTTLASTTKQYNGLLDSASLTANLSGYQGETLNLCLEAHALSSVSYDWAMWKEAYITSEGPTVINVSSYGAYPNDANDDTTAIQNAINAAAGSGRGVKIVFQSGEYKLSGLLGLSSMARGIVLKGAPGSATTFTCTNRNAGVIGINQCYSPSITVEDITIDYNPLPFTQGTVNSVGANYIDLYIDAGYPELDDGWFNTVSKVALIMNPSYPGRIKTNTSGWHPVTSVTKLGAGQFRVYLSDMAGIAASDKAVVQGDGAHAIWAQYSPDTQVLFKNINMWSSSLFAYVGVGVNKVFSRNCNTCIKPGTNRLHGPNSDGGHMQGCKYGPEVINCLYEGLSDDGANIKAMSGPVNTRYADDHYSITAGTWLPMYVGDELVFYIPSSGNLRGHALITSTSVTGYDGIGRAVQDVYIDPPIANVTTSDTVWDRTWMSGHFLIADSNYGNYRGIGIRAKTHDGMICGNNFYGLSYPALELANLPSWGEGLQAENIKFVYNEIDDCCLASGNPNSYTYDCDGSTPDYIGAPIQIMGQSSGPRLSDGKLHSNIEIASNWIYDWPRHAIYAGSTSNLNIHDNVFTNNMHCPLATSGYRGAMYFNNCTSVAVTNNSVTDYRAAGQINGKLFLKRMDDNSTYITHSGNSYDFPYNGGLPEITDVGGTNLGWGAYGNVSGTVSNSATGTALSSNVGVVLDGTTYGTWTDANGAYTISNAPVGGASSFYSLRVENPAYYPKYSPVNIPANSTLTKNVSLVPVDPTWEFLNNSVEGWSAINHLTGFTSSGGILSATISGSDPYMASLTGMALTTRSSNTISIRMLISGGGTGTGYMSWTTTADPSTLRSIAYTVYGDNAWHVYTINVGANQYWTGTINQLRFDPTEGSAYNGKTMQIDYIKVLR